MERTRERVPDSGIDLALTGLHSLQKMELDRLFRLIQVIRAKKYPLIFFEIYDHAAVRGK